MKSIVGRWQIENFNSCKFRAKIEFTRDVDKIGDVESSVEGWVGKVKVWEFQTARLRICRRDLRLRYRIFVASYLKISSSAFPFTYSLSRLLACKTVERNINSWLRFIVNVMWQNRTVRRIIFSLLLWSRCWDFRLLLICCVRNLFSHAWKKNLARLHELKSGNVCLRKMNIRKSWGKALSKTCQALKKTFLRMKDFPALDSSEIDQLFYFDIFLPFQLTLSSIQALIIYCYSLVDF